MNLAQSVSESGAPRVTLRSRVSPFVAGRVVISTIILGSATLVQLSTPGAFPINPFYFLIGLTYGLSVVYLATLRYVDENPWLVDLQLTVDAALVSAFVYVTGGIMTSSPAFRRGRCDVHRAVATREGRPTPWGEAGASQSAKPPRQPVTCRRARSARFPPGARWRP